MKALTQILASAVAISALMAPVAANANVAQLTEATAAAKLREAQHQQQRVNQTQADTQAVTAKLKQQQAQLAQLKAEVKALSDQFSANEATLSAKQKELHLATGALGEVYGVVRQVGNELEGELSRGPLGIVAPERAEAAAALANSKALPALAELQQLPQLMLADIHAGAEIAPFDAEVVLANGEYQPQSLTRFGTFSVSSANGLLQHQDGNWQQFARQPELDFALALDPSMGELSKALQLEPTLQDRFDNGGLVGQIIVGLLLIGLIIALVRGASLIRQQLQINAQLKINEPKPSNALGRVLIAFEENRHQALDAMELKLSEAIVTEQQGLETGLSMLKLLAAIAPMLGLLGTVTGMIETFQTITLYGNSDPKVMAGGISMALTTTVLGLIAAMPLLLAHNLLHSRVVAIRSLLEKESLAMVADFAQRKDAA